MVRKACPQLSVHSVTIRIASAEYVTVRILSATYRKALSIRGQILKNIKKVLRISYLYLIGIKTYHSAVEPKLRTGTVSFGSLPLVTLSYLSHSAYSTCTR